MRVLLALLLASSAHAEFASTGSVSQWGLYAGAGTGKVIASFPTFEACSAGAAAQAKKAGPYTCKASGAVTVAALAPQPPAEKRSVTCPPGYTGSWSQTRTYSRSAGVWVAGDWLPVETPPAACVVIPVPQHPGAPVNPASLMPRAVGFPDVRMLPTTELPPGSDIGAFRTVCDPSHMAYDDPIVFSNQPGKSHLHTFFGNTLTDFASTADSILNSGNSTCRGGIVNRTAYWVPAMVDTEAHAAITPQLAQIYYKTGYNGIAPKDVQALPQGLRMIAGNSQATAPYWGSPNFRCQSGSRGDGPWSNSIPDCIAGEEMWQVISFPQCWDGVNLDSPDHKSHVAGPVNGACPADHPVAIPEVGISVVYTVTTDHMTLKWRLDSDMYDATQPGGYSSHADVFSGWRPDIEKSWIVNCDQASVDCHSHLLGNGFYLY